MGQTVNREQKLKSIQNQMKQVETYMQMDPNPFAKNRVDSLSKNPCLSGKFYLNAIFKDTQTVESAEAAINYATTNSLTYCKYSQYFYDAYIIYPEFWSKDKIEHIAGFSDTNAKIQSLINER